MSSRSPSWYSDVPSAPAPKPRAEGGSWKKPCPAVDAETGLACRLLQHGDNNHRSERGAFRQVAAPGQTAFRRAELLAAAATARLHDGNEGIGRRELLPTRVGRLKRALARRRQTALEETASTSPPAAAPEPVRDLTNGG